MGHRAPPRSGVQKAARASPPSTRNAPPAIQRATGETREAISSGTSPGLAEIGGIVVIAAEWRAGRAPGDRQAGGRRDAVGLPEDQAALRLFTTGKSMSVLAASFT